VTFLCIGKVFEFDLKSTCFANRLGYSEIYLNYYDIFVRNAFGSYFDVLKEVSYSPLMAEMLSFLDSKSSAFVLEDSGAKAYPGAFKRRCCEKKFLKLIYDDI
jgi:hypothetical protein